ncbi:hypothetical protein [Bosea rubneri]|uniref:Tyr recombinase domain-containing protein n=1 Tax=Bosea rubneri TaxID=3075434 RepID=A0ABU3SA96_9HYPH|nr:hypothetical protein [Bosea sp. ZW T0_25]MDU0341337.1 hypothetical protein [Bosea sp. ZW T0_25]
MRDEGLAAGPDRDIAGGGTYQPGGRGRGAVGSFDWLVTTYKNHKSYKDLSDGQKRNHERGFTMVADYVLTKGARQGPRIGTQPVADITTKLVDALYEALLTVTETDEDGNEVQRERKTTTNAAMKSCRRGWNIAYRAEPSIVPKDNPFARMGLNESSTPNVDATFEQLKAFVAKADAENRSSLGTAAMITWEWLQRGEHVFGAFEVAHYQPKERPDAVQIVHPKTEKEVWWPLFDPEQSERVPLFPELMARLDEIKRNRIGGLMLVRDWKDDKEGRPLPWPTGNKGDLTYMRHEVKRIIVAAGLPDNLSFTSFRHGGLTETGDANMTDREILAQSAQTTAKVLPRYVKKTMRQVANGASKRRAVRTDGGQMSE